MAVDRRKKDVEWNVLDEHGNWYSGNHAGIHAAVLMDIRDELKRLNQLLHCHNFIGIPATLRTISKKIPVRKKK